MKISRVDVVWNYAASFLKIASSVILLPFILRMMPSETVAIWTIFMTVTAFSTLFDFGFNPTFTRNISYVFSGVRTLKSKGLDYIDSSDRQIDFNLLFNLMRAMRWFYSRISIIVFIVFATFGTYYVKTLLTSYNGSRNDVYIAWLILIVINTYGTYTLYYESLLIGRGLVKRAKQIVILGQVVYLTLASLLILRGYGLVAIVSAQAASVIIIRLFSYHSFFTNEIRKHLSTAKSSDLKEVIKTISPNAIKIGFTSFGGFLVQRSSIIIGSLYLSLEQMASYGISLQLVLVISGLSGIYISTYTPQIAQLRVVMDIKAIRNIYLKSQFIIFLTYLAGGFTIIIFAKPVLNLISSQTDILPPLIMSALLLIMFLESNHSVAGQILLSENKVPFFRASLVAGALTLILLFSLFELTHLNLWALVIAPGIAHLYNNWKWPYEVFKQLGITQDDILQVPQLYKKVNRTKW
ncbi:MAG: hypothetical protein IH591_19750 [Bacteroidales bacterium]|nr:hypothetical protein [Bacteroidales bacterium]